MRAPLLIHPSQTCAHVDAASVTLARDEAGVVALTYLVRGRIERLRVPGPTAPARVDGLWRTTCFELFCAQDGAPAYREFNLSPSGQWAAYAFDGYRAGMRALDLAAPAIETAVTADTLAVHVTLAAGLAPGAAWRLGLSAVIEDRDGVCTHWALAHPEAAPNFHHASAFALALA